MNINKYKKMGNSFYRIYLDNDYIDVHENLILKYKLLINKKISNDLMQKIQKENNVYLAYNKALKYLNIRLRSQKEIQDYLYKMDFNKTDIKQVIKLLSDEGYVNDNNYCVSYINDRINLSNDGPRKIENDLIKNGLDKDIIITNLGIFSDDIINDKLKKMILKSVTINKNNSSKMLKQKVIHDLILKGYDKSSVDKLMYLLENYNDHEAYEKEYKKLYSQLSKKYTGKELELKVNQKLYQKGFRINGYNYE